MLIDVIVESAMLMGELLLGSIWWENWNGMELVLEFWMVGMELESWTQLFGENWNGIKAVFNFRIYLCNN